MRLTRSVLAISCIAIVLLASLVPSASTFIAVTLVVILVPAAGIVVRHAPPPINVQRASLLAVTLLRAPPSQA